MHLETGCGIIDPKYIGIFCVDGVTVKGYDVYRLDAGGTQTLIRTDYFNIVDNSIVVPVTAPTEGACPIAGATQYDYEKELLCEKLTGRKVLIESRVDVLDPTQARQGRITYLVGGAVFAGDPELDLENCPDTDVESDPQIMCDNGTTFMRWYEKSNGLPTTNFYDRTVDYAVYTPVGPVTLGACNGQTLSIGSELLNVSGVSTLTPTVGAVYAVISVNEGEAWITVDGTTPVVGDSHPVYEGQYVYLQIANELTDFKAIGNPTAKLYVTYYDKQLLLSQI